MAVSRNPIPFLERTGLVKTRRHPVPRLDTVRMAVRDLPFEDPAPRPESLLDVAGHLPSDRGVTGPWPPPQEVQDDEQVE